MSKLQGVYDLRGKIATENLVRGQKVYNEELVSFNGKQLRIWNPFRSKLGAAILGGLRAFPFQKGSKVLYLGAASGTTASHVSDIVGENGLVYCVEFSPIVGLNLVSLCEKRKNMFPIIDDARIPENYSGFVEPVDVVYEDVADKEQARILIENSRMFLKPKGVAMIAIKARCIDSARTPEQVYSAVLKELESEFEILEKINLEPFETDHLFVVRRKKN